MKRCGRFALIQPHDHWNSGDWEAFALCDLIFVGEHRRPLCPALRSPATFIEDIEMPKQQVGRTVWVIAEGYIPLDDETDRRFVSHETACILNASDRAANVSIMLYFADREPVGPYRVTIAARRTHHLRFNDLCDPEPVPREADYSSVFESDTPIVVQHTRLDSRRANLALFSTMAYAD